MLILSINNLCCHFQSRRKIHFCFCVQSSSKFFYGCWRNTKKYVAVIHAYVLCFLSMCEFCTSKCLPVALKAGEISSFASALKLVASLFAHDIEKLRLIEFLVIHAYKICFFFLSEFILYIKSLLSFSELEKKIQFCSCDQSGSISFCNLWKKTKIYTYSCIWNQFNLPGLNSFD